MAKTYKSCVTKAKEHNNTFPITKAKEYNITFPINALKRKLKNESSGLETKVLLHRV